MNTRTKTNRDTTKRMLLCSCLLTPFLFFASCKKAIKKDTTTKYVVGLAKIDGGDTLLERKPFIHWYLNVQPLDGAYSVFSIAKMDSGETPMQAIERHGKGTRISIGSSFQYVQGYPLLDKGARYAYKVDVSPGAGLPLVSSDIYTLNCPPVQLPLWWDNLSADFLANTNIHTDPAGNIAVDVSWNDMNNDGKPVKIEIMEVDCCHFAIADPMWVGPNGEWPWTNPNGSPKPGGHMQGGGVPVCQWELEQNRQQAFTALSFPVVFTTTQSIMAWGSNGNSTIVTSCNYDAGKCYLLQITDIGNNWKNTFYITGSL